VVFGVTRSGRRKDQPGGADGVGLFINTLPFRVSVEASAPLLPWLSQLRSRWLALREFEHTPLDKIRQWSGLSLPLFDSVLVYDHEPPGETLRKLGGGWLHRTFQRLQRTDSPLTLVAYGAPQLTLEIVYDARLFSPRTITGMTEHLATLLLSFLAPGDVPLARVKMLPERELQWHLRELNQTGAPFVLDQCAHRLFEQQVQRTPEITALEDGEEVISFQEVNRRANRLAWMLRERGAGPEDLIALHMPRSPEVVIAVMAALKAGAAFMPLDPALPPDRLAVMMQDARPKFVLCAKAGIPELAGCGCQTLHLETLHDEIARQSSENLPDIAVPANAAYAIFTSGSTGRPKAAVITHRSLVNYAQAVAGVYGISPTDRRLQFASLASDVFVSEVFTFLCSGAALIFGLNRENTSLREFLRFLAERRITVTGMPASWWKEWVSTLTTEELELPPSLRAVTVGMERVDPAAFQKWNRLAGSRIRTFNAYGPTETCPMATIYEAGSSIWESTSRVPIGKPIANARAYVLDGDGNVPPVGVPGELYIGGEAVGRGYLNVPELTAQKFLPDPHREDPSARVYRTGDLVYRLPDGNLIFLGRVDRQLKIRGFRIEPEEIEAALQEYPGVRECAVTADRRQRLVAYLAWAGGKAPFADELRLHLSRRLPAHMVPGEFLALGEMPHTLSGKVDLQALPRLEAITLRPAAGFKSPSTPTERRLAALWQEALGRSSLGVTDDFFESGGDSLSATVLITLVEWEFQREISLATLFQAPTIARLAARLESDEQTVGKVLRHQVIPLQSKGSLPPFIVIAPIEIDTLRFVHVCRLLGNDQPFYALINPLADTGRLQTIEALAAEVRQTIRAARLNGPYFLGGYCLGGVVAFEAAHQLLARGEDVRMVVLFETPAPGYPKPRQLLRACGWYIRHLGQVSGGESEQAVGSSFGTLFSDVRRVGRFLRRKGLANIDRTALRAGRTPQVPGGNMGAQVSRSAGIYVPKLLPVPVAQFTPLGDGTRPPILEDRLLGWGDLCRAEFHFRQVSGDHTTMWQEPHAVEMAAMLKELFQPLNVPRGADVVA
jgi:amino acid adenylation domain-containing protein